MAEMYQAAVSRSSSASKTTLRLVVAYHFLVGAFLGVAIILVWQSAKFSQEDAFIAKAISGVAAPLAVLYLVVGWGILRRKSWSRTVSIVLNWMNVGAGAISVARLGNNPEGAINVLLSCLVLWGLSMPAVKLEFRPRSEAR
jgi:hypothetical protein